MELPPEEEADEEALDPAGELFAIEQMLAQRAPYEDVVAALDALAPHTPTNDPHACASIAHTRLSAASMYHRSDAEIAQAIEQYLADEPILWRRLSATLAACMDSPALFRQYVDPLITEAQAIDKADEPLVQVLATAKKARERVLGT